MPLLLTILTFLASIAYVFTSVSAEVVFIHCFYDANFRWHKKKAFFLLLVALPEAIIEAFFPALFLHLAISFYIVKFFVVIYDYSGKKIKGILRFLLVSTLIELCISTICDAGAYLLIPDYDPLLLIEYPKSVDLFVYSVHSVFCLIIFLYLYFRLYKKGIVIKCGVLEVVLAVLYPLLCTFVPATIILLGRDSTVTLLILSVMAVLLALLVPVFIYYMRIHQHYEKRTLHQENHMQTELAHFTQYKQSQEETARFRHDIRNHLLCLNSLLVDEKTEEATKYLQDLLFTAEELRQQYVSGDEMLDCIISVKANDMVKQNIRFSLDGVLAGGLPWKPMDICNVFANALDNAIEACQKVAPEKRHISMNIKSTPQFWMVSIENAVAEAVDTSKLFQKNGGYTSKSNADRHGIGTYNMKHTVESYGSMLKAECTDEVFKLEIMIDKSSTKGSAP